LINMRSQLPVNPTLCHFRRYPVRSLGHLDALLVEVPKGAGIGENSCSMTCVVDEFELRRRALAAQLPQWKVDWLLVSFLANVRYLTGYTGNNGFVL
jgi:Creatinase/Prolidase N-terminal domain